MSPAPPADDFESVAERMSQISDVATSDKLRLYALYKQATSGDNGSPQPGLLAMTDRAKWDAWTQLKGMPAGVARAEYIQFAAGIVTKVGSK